MNFLILFLLSTPLFHFVFITVNITAVCMADNQPISNIHIRKRYFDCISHCVLCQKADRLSLKPCHYLNISITFAETKSRAKKRQSYHLELILGIFSKGFRNAFYGRLRISLNYFLEIGNTTLMKIRVRLYGNREKFLKLYYMKIVLYCLVYLIKFFYHQ
jgi:hypothetical protein